MILAHHYMQMKSWLTSINWPYQCFWLTMWKGLCSWENAEEWVICELLMREAKSWQAKGAILQHHCM
jgi:hypothetical protein